MQKYIYWTIIFLFVVNSNVLGKEALQNNTIGLPNNINANQAFIKKLKIESDKSRKKYGSVIFEKKVGIGFKKNKKLAKYLAYFYSESMPFSAIKRLIIEFYNLKKIDKNIQLYIVLNGFPKRSFFNKLRKLYKPEYSKLFKIKIHPPMYSYFKLLSVPAYALMQCPKDFRFGKCKKKEALLVRGDISLTDFFQILSDHNKKYSNIYQKLITIGM